MIPKRRISDIRACSFLNDLSTQQEHKAHAVLIVMEGNTEEPAKRLPRGVIYLAGGIAKRDPIFLSKTCLSIVVGETQGDVAAQVNPTDTGGPWMWAVAAEDTQHRHHVVQMIRFSTGVGRC